MEYNLATLFEFGEGKLRWLPRSWTSLAAQDPYFVATENGGRSEEV